MQSFVRAPAAIEGVAGPDVIHVLLPEILDRGGDRAGREVSEGAEHLARNLAGDREQQVEVALVAPAVLDADQRLVEPLGALTAGGALPARLLAEELDH